MIKFKIIGSKTSLDGNGHEYLDSLYVEDPSGKKFYLDIDSYEGLDEMTQDEKCEWAIENKGRTLVCEDIETYTYIAKGSICVL